MDRVTCIEVDGALDRVADQLRVVLRDYPGPLDVGGTTIEASVRLGLNYALSLIESERALIAAQALERKPS